MNSVVDTEPDENHRRDRLSDSQVPVHTFVNAKSEDTHNYAGDARRTR
jgi:hypothetical protein